MTINELNNEFSLEVNENYLHFINGKGDIPVVIIKNKLASASISLQGAHLLSWCPNNEDDVIWLSADATYKSGKSVRGGIPLCWPWFGAHQGNDTFPAHGFARTTNWQIISTEALQNGCTRISFTTQATPENSHMWPANTTVQYQVTIGDKLELELITHNNDTAPITIGQAFHSYFKVGDINQTLIHGLDDTDYLDKPDAFKRKVQHGPVNIEEEVDRIYLDTAGECLIDDKSLNRRIAIIKCGSHSTVVWNPGKEVADKMGDLGENGYKQMLCVESCNAAEDVITIQPGKVHQLWVQYELLPLV